MCILKLSANIAILYTSQGIVKIDVALYSTERAMLSDE
jgi:hypothetical protein